VRHHVGDQTGKIVLVTGGAQGIGLGIARVFVSRGAKVAIVDVGSEQSGAAADALVAEGGLAMGITADVTNRGSIQQAVDSIADRWGGVNVVINNAGVSILTSFLDADEEAWNRSVAVNLTGTFTASQVCARAMVAEGRPGAIVNIASIAAFAYTADHPIYAATKSGIVALTRDMAYELAPRQIRVNAVAPGPIASPLTDEHGWGNRFDHSLRLGRWGTPEDVGRAVAFLASDEADFITGQTVCVAGGADLRTLDPR
jgi:NAD(P)-dependent dehydrogenase (short-subunit alcohol dehydrogenase family)